MWPALTGRTGGWIVRFLLCLLAVASEKEASVSVRASRRKLYKAAQPLKPFGGNWRSAGSA